jgi:hypothetical protein
LFAAAKEQLMEMGKPWMAGAFPLQRLRVQVNPEHFRKWCRTEIHWRPTLSAFFFEKPRKGWGTEVHSKRKNSLTQKPGY